MKLWTLTSEGRRTPFLRVADEAALQRAIDQAKAVGLTVIVNHITTKESSSHV